MSAKVKKIVILVPILIGIAVCIWGFVSRAGGINIKINSSQQVVPNTHYITITKGVWSQKIDTTGRRFRVVSVTPPARRMTMVNGNPDRIHHLPAGPASDINVGTDVRSHEFMIEPDETVSSSVVGYEFY